jgi:DNA-binding transcriptional MerR regulator
VLRFWESRFTQIRPLKRGGGRRYYRPDDIDLLRGVRHLLYSEGYTIRGVQRILREEGLSFVQNVWRSGAAPLVDGTADEDRAESAEAFENEEEGESEADGEDDEGADDDDEEGEEDEEGEPVKVANRAPEPPIVTRPAAVPARPEERREPNLIPPVASVAALPRTATASQGRQTGIGGQNQQKLQTALDELIACRDLIRAALAETAPTDEQTDRVG